MKYLFTIILCFYFLSISFAQTRQDLEKKRIQSLKQIEYTNKLIQETRKNRKLSYNRLLLLNSQIQSRRTLINTLNQEISYLSNSIEINKEVIVSLESDLTKLKNEYAKLIYYSYLHRSKYDKLMFVLASDNINMAFRRVKYLQQYSKFRIAQAQKIVSSREKLAEKIVQLELLKGEKEELLADYDSENRKLLAEKNQKNQEVKKLSKKEKELRAKLREQNKLAEQLNRKIQKIIEEEARIASRKNKGSDYFSLTPEEQLIADVFYKNKHRLPWPTERGVVTGFFGEQPHPFLKGIKIRNDGIDITTTEGALVRAIYSGTVSRVFVIQGAHKTVIIRHGNYLSVYSNLKEVFVKQGDKVLTKQNIGIVYTDKDSDHKTVLQFQLWKENEKLNPQDWLARSSNG